MSVTQLWVFTVLNTKSESDQTDLLFTDTLSLRNFYDVGPVEVTNFKSYTTLILLF